ncbi:MAG: hypothetical protein WC099_01260 [Candidatus Paceibacterota bacterium]
MKSVIRILRRPLYIGCTIGGALVGYGIISFSIHSSLIIALLTSSHVVQTIPAVLHILLQGTYTVGGWVASITSIGISLLWGVMVSLSIYYLRHAKTIRVIATSGIRGVLALVGGALGAGCWACGGIFIAPLLGIIAGGVSMTLLYIGGTIISLVSFGLLIYSLYRLTRAIQTLPTQHI